MTDPIRQLGSESFALCKQTQVPTNRQPNATASSSPFFRRISNFSESLRFSSSSLPNVYRAKRGKNNLEQAGRLADNIARISLWLSFPRSLFLARPLFRSLPLELFPSLCSLVHSRKFPSLPLLGFLCTVFLSGPRSVCVCCSFSPFHAQTEEMRVEKREAGSHSLARRVVRTLTLSVVRRQFWRLLPPLNCLWR